MGAGSDRILALIYRGEKKLRDELRRCRNSDLQRNFEESIALCERMYEHVQTEARKQDEREAMKVQARIAAQEKADRNYADWVRRYVDGAGSVVSDENVG
jgi:hypothetical protein